MEGLLTHVLYYCIAVIEIRWAEQSQIMLVLRMLHPEYFGSLISKTEIP